MSDTDAMEYEPPVSPEIKQAYENQMAGVFRWKEAKFSSAKPETNKDHMDASKLLHKRNKVKYPNLTSGLSDHTVLGMIYVHDGGELISGDLEHDRVDYDELYKKWKRKEHLGGIVLISKYIEDPKEKEEVRLLYNRATKKDINDPEALYHDVLDKTQAIQFGGEFVFPGNRLNLEEQKEKLEFCTDLLLKSSVHLIKLLPEKGQRELKEMILSDLAVLGATGYSDELVAQSKKRVDEALTVLQAIAT